MLKNKIIKIMKKVILLFSLLFLSVSYVFAATINLSTDKTNLTTDEILEIHLSVGGQIDNGKVVLKGLENFNIIGQSTTQNIVYINGKMTAKQEQILDLQPKNGGNFEIQALAKENKKEIKSQKIVFNVQKSLIQKTKEELLKGVQNNNKNTVTTKQINQQKNNFQNIENKKDSLKKLLTENQVENQKNKNKNDLDLKSFPNVKYISPFNFDFYLNFSTLFTILIIFFFIFYQMKNNKK